MSAWRIDGGIQFDFGLDTVLVGGGYIVIARDPQALQGGHRLLRGAGSVHWSIGQRRRGTRALQAQSP